MHLKLLNENIDTWRKTVSIAQIPVDSAHHHYAVSLAEKTVGLLKAGFLLFENNHVREGNILYRSALECAFKLAAIMKEAHFVFSLLSSDSLERLNSLRNMEPKDPSDIPKYQQALKTCEEEVQKWSELGIEPKKISKFDVAKKGGLESQYRVNYFYYSLNAHGDGKELEEFLELDENREITGMVLEPEQTGASKEVIRLCGLSAQSLYYFCKIFELDTKNAEDLLKKADELMEAEVNKKK